MPRPRLAVALDLADAETAIAAGRELQGHADIVKVGLELFVGAGPALVERLVGDGWAVFLDLKLHDIPATVAGAVRSARRLGVELLTLHTSGGREMITAAAEARGGETRPRLLGVTILTSLDDEQMIEIGMPGGSRQGVERLARLARDAGCDGVVSSPREVAAVKRLCGTEFLAVAPGIRPAGAARNDQSRVATPGDAVRAGADVLVIGRPIMKAPDPSAAADAIRAEMERAYDRNRD